MARRVSSRTRLRLLAALLLIVMIGGGFAWWHLHHWRPDRQAYPVQGVEISSEDGEVNWKAIKAIGADFAYIDASASAFARDPAFIRNLETARDAGLQVGAVHRYDPCQPADKQAGNFVTVVPRDSKLLPPVVELDRLGDQCPMTVRDAAIESELTTFLNQVETHTGKPAILKISKRFEDRYGIAARIDRNLWLTRDRFQPDYGGRPWTLWTANSAYDSDAGAPLHWVVVQP
jgi:lysozyme